MNVWVNTAKLSAMSEESYSWHWGPVNTCLSSVSSYFLALIIHGLDARWQWRLLTSNQELRPRCTPAMPFALLNTSATTWKAMHHALCSVRMTVEDTVPISASWEGLEFGGSREEEQRRCDMVKLAWRPPQSHWLVQGTQRPAVGRRRSQWRRQEEVRAWARTSRSLACPATANNPVTARGRGVGQTSRPPSQPCSYYSSPFLWLLSSSLMCSRWKAQTLRTKQYHISGGLEDNNWCRATKWFEVALNGNVTLFPTTYFISSPLSIWNQGSLWGGAWAILTSSHHDARCWSTIVRRSVACRGPEHILLTCKNNENDYCFNILYGDLYMDKHGNTPLHLFSPNLWLITVDTLPWKDPSVWI